MSTAARRAKGSVLEPPVSVDGVHVDVVDQIRFHPLPFDANVDPSEAEAGAYPENFRGAVLVAGHAGDVGVDRISTDAQPAEQIDWTQGYDGQAGGVTTFRFELRAGLVGTPEVAIGQLAGEIYDRQGADAVTCEGLPRSCVLVEVDVRSVVLER